MTAARWRRRPLERLAPAKALERAEALLEGAAAQDRATTAWSMASSPALVLGRAARDPMVDSALAERLGITVLRRASGGGAVLWDDGLLALDVALPARHELVLPDVVETYAWLGQAFADALSRLGLADVELVSVTTARSQPPPEDLRAVACFGSLSPYEVTIGGRKVLGLSQVRRRHGTLLQAGLLLDHDATTLARLLGWGAAAARALERSTTTIGRRDAGEVVAAVERVLA